MIKRLMGMMALVVAVGLIAAACTGGEGATGAKGEKGDPGERGAQGLPGGSPSDSELSALIDQALAGTPATAESIAKGGRLYDKWVKEAGVTQPGGDQTLWALQTSNVRTGVDTYRCKECHGWDYKGIGGAYSKGSHKTGFPGVIKASATMSKDELMGVM
ncbi:MAG: hypothetical protein HW388_1648 [Dehalococcoidia bacterium]|nr:hypothetical protein [Dehalococcoidia bacterium]